MLCWKVPQKRRFQQQRDPWLEMTVWKEPWVQTAGEVRVPATSVPSGHRGTRGVCRPPWGTCGKPWPADAGPAAARRPRTAALSQAVHGAKQRSGNTLERAGRRLTVILWNQRKRVCAACRSPQLRGEPRAVGTRRDKKPGLRLNGSHSPHAQQNGRRGLGLPGGPGV